MYIPILDTHVTTRREMIPATVATTVQMNVYQPSTDGILHDFCDGSHCENHPLAQLDSTFFRKPPD